MTKAEARRYVFRCLAESLDSDIASGAGYLIENVPAKDRERVMLEAQAIVDELSRRGKHRSRVGKEVGR